MLQLQPKRNNMVDQTTAQQIAAGRRQFTEAQSQITRAQQSIPEQQRRASKLTATETFRQGGTGLKGLQVRKAYAQQKAANVAQAYTEYGTKLQQTQQEIATGSSEYEDAIAKGIAETKAAFASSNPGEKLIMDADGNITGVESSFLGQSISYENYGAAIDRKNQQLQTQYNIEVQKAEADYNRQLKEQERYISNVDRFTDRNWDALAPQLAEKSGRLYSQYESLLKKAYGDQYRDVLNAQSEDVRNQIDAAEREQRDRQREQDAAITAGSAEYSEYLQQPDAPKTIDLTSKVVKGTDVSDTIKLKYEKAGATVGKVVGGIAGVNPGVLGAAYGAVRQGYDVVGKLWDKPDTYSVQDWKAQTINPIKKGAEIGAKVTTPVWSATGAAYGNVLEAVLPKKQEQQFLDVTYKTDMAIAKAGEKAFTASAPTVQKVVYGIGEGLGMFSSATTATIGTIPIITASTQGLKITDKTARLLQDASKLKLKDAPAVVDSAIDTFVGRDFIPSYQAYESQRQELKDYEKMTKKVDKLTSRYNKESDAIRDNIIKSSGTDISIYEKYKDTPSEQIPKEYKDLINKIREEQYIEYQSLLSAASKEGLTSKDPITGEIILDYGKQPEKISQARRYARAGVSGWGSDDSKLLTTAEISSSTAQFAAEYLALEVVTLGAGAAFKAGAAATTKVAKAASASAKAATLAAKAKALKMIQPGIKWLGAAKQSIQDQRILGQIVSAQFRAADAAAAAKQAADAAKFFKPIVAGIKTGAGYAVTPFKIAAKGIGTGVKYTTASIKIGAKATMVPLRIAGQKVVAGTKYIGRGIGSGIEYGKAGVGAGIDYAKIGLGYAIRPVVTGGQKIAAGARYVGSGIKTGVGYASVPFKIGGQKIVAGTRYVGRGIKTGAGYAAVPFKIGGQKIAASARYVGSGITKAGRAVEARAGLINEALLYGPARRTSKIVSDELLWQGFKANAIRSYAWTTPVGRATAATIRGGAKAGRAAIKTVGEVPGLIAYSGFGTAGQYKTQLREKSKTWKYGGFAQPIIEILPETIGQRTALLYGTRVLAKAPKAVLAAFDVGQGVLGQSQISSATTAHEKQTGMFNIGLSILGTATYAAPYVQGAAIKMASKVKGLKKTFLVPETDLLSGGTFLKAEDATQVYIPGQSLRSLVRKEGLPMSKTEIALGKLDIASTKKGFTIGLAESRDDIAKLGLDYGNVKLWDAVRKQKPLSTKVKYKVPTNLDPNEKALLNLAAVRGDTLGGSGAAESILVTARRRGDLDIITKDPKGYVSQLLKDRPNLKSSYNEKFNQFKITDKLTGREYADIVDIKSYSDLRFTSKNIVTNLGRLPYEEVKLGTKTLKVLPHDELLKMKLKTYDDTVSKIKALKNMQRNGKISKFKYDKQLNTLVKKIAKTETDVYYLTGGEVNGIKFKAENFKPQLEVQNGYWSSSKEMAVKMAALEGTTQDVVTSSGGGLFGVVRKERISGMKEGPIAKGINVLAGPVDDTGKLIPAQKIAPDLPVSEAIGVGLERGVTVFTSPPDTPGGIPYARKSRLQLKDDIFSTRSGDISFYQSTPEIISFRNAPITTIKEIAATLPKGQGDDLLAAHAKWIASDSAEDAAKFNELLNPYIRAEVGESVGKMIPYAYAGSPEKQLVIRQGDIIVSQRAPTPSGVQTSAISAEGMIGSKRVDLRYAKVKKPTTSQEKAIAKTAIKFMSGDLSSTEAKAFVSTAKKVTGADYTTLPGAPDKYRRVYNRETVASELPAPLFTLGEAVSRELVTGTDIEPPQYLKPRIEQSISKDRISGLKLSKTPRFSVNRVSPITSRTTPTIGTTRVIRSPITPRAPIADIGIRPRVDVSPIRPVTVARSSRPVSDERIFRTDTTRRVTRTDRTPRPFRDIGRVTRVDRPIRDPTRPIRVDRAPRRPDDPTRPIRVDRAPRRPDDPTRPIRVYRKPPFPRRPAIPKPTKRKEKRKKKRILQPGFEVLVRRKGKFESLGVSAPREEAIALGVKTILGEAAATFKVVETKKAATTTGIAVDPRLLKLYRAGKSPGEYIQKAKLRIITAGEKKDISFAGIKSRTSKTRTKQGKKIKFI